jgi:hypothetical protein
LLEEKEIQDHHSIQELVEVVLQKLDKIHNLMVQVVEVEQEEHLQSQDHVYHLVAVVELEVVQVDHLAQVELEEQLLLAVQADEDKVVQVYQQLLQQQEQQIEVVVEVEAFILV